MAPDRPSTSAATSARQATLADSIAHWDGQQWSALAGPLGVGVRGADSSVRALAVFDDGGGPALYVGGSFNTSGGVTASGVAKWNGNTWSAIPGTPNNGNFEKVHALAVFDDGTGPALYAGGTFASFGSLPWAQNIVRWDGTTWSNLHGPYSSGTNSGVYSLAVFNDGTGAALFAGGSFDTAGGVRVNGIAKWNGTDWSALSGPSGVGVSSPNAVEALAVFADDDGPALYAGGPFSAAGGVSAKGIAR